MTALARGEPDTAPAQAVDELVDAVRQLAGLTDQVGPFDLPAGTDAACPAVVASVCRALGVPLTFGAAASGPQADHAAVALATELRRAQAHPALSGLDPAAAAAAAQRRLEAERARFAQHAIRRPDGSSLTAAVAGPVDAPGVLVSLPPGLSLRLALPWLYALSSRFRCVIPQSRGTSGPIGDLTSFDRYGHDMARQESDTLAAVDLLATAAPVHVLGLCGGAGLALAAAAHRPDRIRSCSLWHADLELGDEAPKSDHQVNLRALVDLAGESRDTADWLRTKLVSGPMTGVPERIGPLVVRPYATSELFYRYARLTAATVHWDCRETAAALAQPCLVVTTEDDATTHPAGSRRFASIAPRAELVVAGHGDHLDAFRAGRDQVDLLESFLRSV